MKGTLFYHAGHSLSDSLPNRLYHAKTRTFCYRRDSPRIGSFTEITTAQAEPCTPLKLATVGLKFCHGRYIHQKRLDLFYATGLAVNEESK
jgi:hypothetical protein